MNTNKLPEFLKVYLWSANSDNLEKEKNKSYIIFQLLEFGDKEAVRWVFEKYSIDEIANVLKSRRGFSQKTVNFWSLILKIPKSEMICSTQDWQKPHAKI